MNGANDYALTRPLRHDELVQLQRAAQGPLLIWLDKEVIWLAPHDGWPGRPLVLLNAEIQFCLSIKVLLKLPLSRLQGWWRAC